MLSSATAAAMRAMSPDPSIALAEHRGADRPAGAVRHRADEGGDRDERRGLAFAPADMAAGGDAHEQRVLAAVGLGRDLRHGQIEEVDRFDLHLRLTGLRLRETARPLPGSERRQGRARRHRDAAVRADGELLFGQLPAQRRFAGRIFARLVGPMLRQEGEVGGDGDVRLVAVGDDALAARLRRARRCASAR